MPDLVALVERLCGAGVATAAVPIGSVAEVWPAEASALAGARPARRAEFAAGRAAAREAMRRLGLPAAAVPYGADRAPIWPEGLRGSISHDAGLALAALRRGGAAFGLDLEPARPLEPALWPEIALPGELDHGTLEPGLMARLVFSAKEAAYKAQFPASRTLLGFDAMRIAIDGERITARLWQSAGPYAEGAVFEGAWAICADRLIVAVRAPERIGAVPVSGDATLS